jgi:recombinational DNA repair protein (RecF pathway)
MKNDCYRCGKKLTQEDRDYTHGSGWCIVCRKDYDVERRLRGRSIDDIKAEIKRQERVLRVYKIVLQEKLKEIEKRKRSPINDEVRGEI